MVSTVASSIPGVAVTGGAELVGGGEVVSIVVPCAVSVADG